MEERSMEEEEDGEPGDNPRAAPYDRRSIASSISDIASVFNRRENNWSTHLKIIRPMQAYHLDQILILFYQVTFIW